MLKSEVERPGVQEAGGDDPVPLALDVDRDGVRPPSLIRLPPPSSEAALPPPTISATNAITLRPISA